MIFVSRPAEPTSLQTRRQQALNDCIQHWDGGKLTPQISALLINYDYGKRTLYDAQSRKCLFCERRMPLDYQPLEHFRPKRGAIRTLKGAKPAVTDDHHYWWLCWTWENHTFACATCNGRKGNYFQVVTPMPLPKLDPSQTKLQPAAFDWSMEQALLIDPMAEDPLDHLEWYPTNTSAVRKLWVWQVRGSNPRGDYTREILKLDDNLEFVVDHIQRSLIQDVEEVRHDAQSPATAQRARERWDRLIRDRVEDSRAELRGPSWWALHYLMPATDRAQWGLRDPVRP